MSAVIVHKKKMSKRAAETENETGTGQKQTGKRQKTGSFETKGGFEDELTLTFDDGKELYVSSAFMKTVSPVFQAMLDRDFKERKTGQILLKEKDSGVFQDFLRMLHPTEYKPVTEKNVLQILPLTEEYQIPLAKEACKLCILRMLNRLGQYEYSTLPTGKVPEEHVKIFKRVGSMIQHLNTYSCKNEMAKAAQILSKFPFELYIPKYTSKYLYFSQFRKDLSDIFCSLPDEVKGQILHTRLTSLGRDS